MAHSAKAGSWRDYHSAANAGSLIEEWEKITTAKVNREIMKLLTIVPAVLNYGLGIVYNL